MINDLDLKSGVSIATLASISIMAASVMHTIEFSKGSTLTPDKVLMLAGLLFMLAAAQVFIWSHFRIEVGNIQKGIFEWILGLGFIAILVAALAGLGLFLNWF